MKIASILLLFILLSSSLAKERILVILDSWATKDTHTLMWSHLWSHFDLSFTMADKSDKTLSNYDEANFEHLMILAPGQSVVAREFEEKKLLNFFDSGHNIFMAGD